MGMSTFTPLRLEQALHFLHSYGDETTVLAGGTDILVRYYDRLYELNRVLNICELDELKYIKVFEERIEIGSLVTHAQLEESAIILQHAPFLAEAASQVGSPQIRNRGTIGGNVANSSPAGDTLPPLLALEAEVRLLSLDRGERVVPLSEFLTGPGRNVAKKDELITGFSFPIFPESYQGTFFKLGYRKALAIATINGAVLMSVDGEEIADCRIVLGAVAPTALRAKLAEDMLKGKELAQVSEEVIDNVTDQILQEISPISDLRAGYQYRLDTAKELAGRAIRTILRKRG